MIKSLYLSFVAVLYQHLLKRFFFLLPPLFVHKQMVNFGEILGKSRIIKNIFKSALVISSPKLTQTLHGITFANPVGLSAGFDYDAKLTQILPSLGFGFATVGTITNHAYKGNPPPLLGRLPKSKSLMVNKGFMNKGAKNIAQKLQPLSFTIPLGISIGKTNSLSLKTQKQSIEDIVQAFIIFEKAKITNSYYELNISCPNLKGEITFYPPKNLNELLFEVAKLKIQKPIFIKMPIEKNNKDVLAMMKVIAKYPVIKGLIFGNLQKNRSDPALNQTEVKQFPIGNFSGKPTERRSNELISLAYQKYKNRFTIIGCGGIFNAEDAYLKMQLGASLVQLITGLIFQGPQLIAQINEGLLDLMQQDGVSNIKDIIGTGTS